MADLSTVFMGIPSPNPFWLASAPPTNSGQQIMRAFDAGWGGAVWKTIGEPVVNTASRYSSVDWNGQRLMGLNNIELISDRPVEDNLRELSEVKKRYPRHAVIASLMVSERGMGAAVGQVPEYSCQITEWAKEAARTPVMVKLTPNVTDIRLVARAARRGGADALSAINTINSITGIDLDTLTPRPDVGGMSAHGGYCGPAVKPIALHLVQQIASDPEVGLPISGIGGVSGWREAAEFILLGCGTVQVCTAVMHHGYRIVEDICDGLSNWMDSRGYRGLEDFRGASLGRLTEWKHLDLNYKIVARIDSSKCIGCNLCYVACWDGAHQCIHHEGRPLPAAREAASRASITVTPIAKLDRGGKGNANGAGSAPALQVPFVDEEECVGCNLCSLVCPVENCITMERVETGKPKDSWEQRTAGRTYSRPGQA
jgi:dihydropyrimidine dehydrogenase (NAD+) subunit PreA